MSFSFKPFAGDQSEDKYKMSDCDFQGNKKKRKSALRWFWGFTSIGGLAQTRSTDLNLSRVAWSVVFVAGAVLTIWNFVGVLKDYHANRVITTATQRNDQVITFPAVTICNYNKVHCGNLYDHILKLNNSDTGDATIPGRIEAMCTLYNVGSCYFGILYDDLFRFGEQKAKVICENIGLLNLSASAMEVMTDEEVAGEGVNNILHKLPDEDRIAIAQRHDQLIKSCSFMGSRSMSNPHCKEFLTEPKTLLHPSMGVCFSFNYFPPNYNGTLSPATSVLAGEVYSLDLELALDANHYLGNGLSPRLGARLTLHESSHRPILTSQGYSLGPDNLYTISLDRQYFKREKHPYPSDCLDQWDEITQLTPYLNESIPYDSTMCQSFCMDSYVQSHCNCTIFSIIEIDRNLAEPCDVTDKKSVECVLGYLNNLDYMKSVITDKCQRCTPQCEEFQYMGSLSSSVWPSPSHWISLASRYNLTFNGTGVDEDFAREFVSSVKAAANGAFSKDSDLGTIADAIQTYIEQNFLSVRVYYRSKATYEIIESPEFKTYGDILSNIGGAISLYLGMSFVSVCEIVELLIRSFTDCINKERPLKR